MWLVYEKKMETDKVQAFFSPSFPWSFIYERKTTIAKNYIMKQSQESAFKWYH